MGRGALALLRRGALVALIALVTSGALAGCVHYPTVMDVGGTNLRTNNGRAVPGDGGAVVTFEIVSTGKFGDVITGVTTVVAKQARLVDGAGAALTRYEVPGAATVKFTADGPHIVLSELARPLVKGENFIVTLTFEKSGGIGIVTAAE
jgi:copper(I)-binding protein